MEVRLARSTKSRHSGFYRRFDIAGLAVAILFSVGTTFNPSTALAGQIRGIGKLQFDMTFKQIKALNVCGDLTDPMNLAGKIRAVCDGLNIFRVTDNTTYLDFKGDRLIAISIEIAGKKANSKEQFDAITGEFGKASQDFDEKIKEYSWSGGEVSMNIKQVNGVNDITIKYASSP